MVKNPPKCGATGGLPASASTDKPVDLRSEWKPPLAREPDEPTEASFKPSTATSGAAALIAVAVEGDAEALLPRTEALAADLGLPVVTGADRDRFSFLLVRTDERLELRETGRGRSGPVFVDLLGGRMGRRRRNVVGAERMLAKAVGFKRKGLSVVDATAGLGRDAFLLACMGCEVTAVERSPVIAALLADGVRRAAADPELGEILRRRLRLVTGDAQKLLREMGESQRPDVVYLDPMFPSRQKSAAVKKEMRICRAVAGDDPDAAELLDIAVVAARRRVVVKRPLRAPTLGRKPTMAYTGTTIRYDVYLPPSGDRPSWPIPSSQL